MVETIRLVIADKHTGLREGIRRVVNENQTITVVGEIADFDQFNNYLMQAQPDVLVLSLNILPHPTVEATLNLQKRHSKTKLLFYAETCDRFCLNGLLSVGVSGCVLKDEPINELVIAIQTIANGGIYFSRQVLTQLAQSEDETTLNPLTAREQEILQLIAQGLNNQQIA